MQDFSLIIGGRAIPGASTMKIINPATERVIAICPRADERQLDAAVQAARTAFPAWRETPIGERRAMLLQVAGAIESRADEIARLLTAEQGKPLAEAMGETLGAAYLTRALAALELDVEVLREDDAGKVVIHRTPLGVVAAITPWNFPVSLLIVKIVPALLAGNTVVAKPAATTPLTTLLIGKILNDLLPPGVLNVITDQNDLGGKLTGHPDVAKISFTGSTATGRRVMDSAASALKRITLELGGNDAAIVLDGVDPAEVAPKLFGGAMVNAGQVCLAIKRVYVPENMYDAICDELAKLARAAVVGDGLDPGSQIGPLQNRKQYLRVRDLIEETRREGKIIAGGDLPEGRGYFVRPTIVRDIADDSRLVREEQFGPVLPIMKYQALDEAIARANDSDYGLGGTIWANDPDEGLTAAMKIDSGLVWVNQHMAIDPGISTGGAKHSGIGRELGLEGLHEFTQAHTIYLARR